ncbi:MIP family Ig-specific serine endopeptidase [Candidatus Mycoplasma haematohominis]|uniref:DUF31 domain-containing protein n=1 Tax=Candidatus Mycoplasma haematohominis TaxID=1494318 RepID=A0A478FQI5_9MOLU|nr:DUF31 family protein [Candidatus Mycoplasma haemohominis]GCE63602.1 hypothetical protein MHSWG343_05990 [Candidatus Mycoplasma haemohominis]
MNKWIPITLVPTFIGVSFSPKIFYLIYREEVEVYIPLAIENKELIADLEKSKAADYTHEWKVYRESNYSYEWYERWNESKKIDVAKGKEIIKTIQDYSFKLWSWRRGSGTSWFLDYVLPRGNRKYPTKWFIATNYHVIEGFDFRDNPYKQVLPQSPRSFKITDLLWDSHEPWIISKERNKDWTTITDEEQYKELAPEYWTKAPKQEVKNSDLHNAANGIDKEYLYFSENNAKLFYAPINYLGVDISSLSKKPLKHPNYFKDFAVVEVDFKNEKTAQLITRDFYNKYDKEKGKIKDKALNFFSEELLVSKTTKDIKADKMNYFLAGYPSNIPHTFRSQGNFSPFKKKASELDWRSSGGWEREVIGHWNTSLTQNFGNVNYISWGYHYSIDSDFPLIKGSSGSLAVDENKNVIGLNFIGNDTYRNGIEPLRSKGLYENGKIVYPKYDLLEGEVGQLSSYKSQVVKYYLSRGYETALSRDRGWRFK